VSAVEAGKTRPAFSAYPDTRAQVLDEFRQADRFVLVTHEHPDGDALGSLVAMHRILRALGKDSVMLMSADEFPLPHEYRFFDLDGLESVPPDDLEERTVIFLDCGNIDRNPAEALKQDGVHILNLDHHHDNTRFGTVNHVVQDASCTAEIVWDLMRALDVEPTPEIAEALYVGLVTDTGKFMYENTGVRAHLMAAELIEAGVDVHRIYRRLYEDMPYAKLELLGRALAHVQRYDDGALTYARLSRDDFRMSGAEESYSEGIIDHLRSVEGTKVAALARELLSEAGAGRKKVSLRAADGSVDVSIIARVAGGGGHRQAAGFSTELADEELVAFLRDQVALQL
jgi:bifunctional oligoribonuclease and PAP phosphatase NrnA